MLEVRGIRISYETEEEAAKLAYELWQYDVKGHVDKRNKFLIVSDVYEASFVMGCIDEVNKKT